MYETINDYMENPNMDSAQLNELLIIKDKNEINNINDI